MKWRNDETLGGIEGCISAMQTADPDFGKYLYLGRTQKYLLKLNTKTSLSVRRVQLVKTKIKKN